MTLIWSPASCSEVSLSASFYSEMCPLFMAEKQSTKSAHSQSFPVTSSRMIGWQIRDEIIQQWLKTVNFRKFYLGYGN